MIPVVLADVQTKFNPRRIPGLSVWLQADRGFTLSDGDPISTWYDQSGKGNNVLQSIGDKKPLWKENILNGRPVVRFDGTDDYLQSSAFDSALGQPNTIFVVGYAKDAEGNPLNFCDGLDVFNRHAMNAQVADTPDSLNSYAGINFSPSVDFPKNSWHLFTVLFDGASSEYWLDGASQGTGDVGDQDLGGLTVGANWNVSLMLEGDMYAILVYSGDIGLLNRGKVHTYLAQKAGITLS